MKRSPLQRGTKQLSAYSPKRAAERATRRQVCDEVFERSGGQCEAVDKLVHTCGGPFDVHELVRRSQWAAGYLVVSNCVLVCRVAHDWIGANPETAVEVGLSKWSWQRNEET